MTCPREPSRVCPRQSFGLRYSFTVPSSANKHPFIRLWIGKLLCRAILPIRVTSGDDTVMSYSIPYIHCSSKYGSNVARAAFLLSPSVSRTSHINSKGFVPSTSGRSINRFPPSKASIICLTLLSSSLVSAIVIYCLRI